jgi:ketosteroid isomerase-like protein
MAFTSTLGDLFHSKAFDLVALRCCAAVAMAAWAVAGVSAQAPSDERQIRNSRAQSNAAIEAHDVSAIARFWMDDVHITTSTSVQANGWAVNGSRMSEQFKRRPDTNYVRTPSKIDVFAAWAVASERGEWVGRWTEADGPLEIRGTYLAQWRKVNGRWLIQSELYVPTQCKGGKYCKQRP